MILTWDKIKTVGEVKALKSSYLFLIVVPPLARLLGSIEETTDFMILGAALRLHISLPFSWIALYFCSLFVSLGNLIYVFACPSIVRDFSTFEGFTASARGGIYLRTVLSQLCNGANNVSTVDAVDMVRNKYNVVPDGSFILNVKGQLSSSKEQGSLSDAFYFLRDSANHFRRKSRIVASLAYAIGFCLLGVIFIQNAWFVFRILLKC